MNKKLINKIILELKKVHQGSMDAAQRAYDTATDEENKAENKYDTLGLEASYLAHGQAQRVLECEADVIAFQKLENINVKTATINSQIISLGDLVGIENSKGIIQSVFLSPVAGGLKIQFNKKEITLVTLSSPLGKALLGCFVDDEIQVQMADDKIAYQIILIE